jgi:uncharacterized protein (DUF433 family)
VNPRFPGTYLPPPAATPVDPLLDRITLDPNVCHGQPTIRGLRYPVVLLLELLGGGMTPEEILADYEDLEADDIRAALRYAQHLAQVKAVVP